MAGRKKAASAAETERTSTTRGKTVQEAAEAAGPALDPVTGEESKGFYGETPDDTPNEHYTVSGVLAGKPVPETDSDR